MIISNFILDEIGQEVRVGDWVCFIRPNYRRLQFCEVEKVTANYIFVVTNRFYGTKPVTCKVASFIKMSDEQVEKWKSEQEILEKKCYNSNVTPNIGEKS